MFFDILCRNIHNLPLCPIKQPSSHLRAFINVSLKSGAFIASCSHQFKKTMSGFFCLKRFDILICTEVSISFLKHQYKLFLGLQYFVYIVD
jgi:hypothetical protein